MELFEQIRREYEHGVGTIRAVAQKLGIHRRMVRQAVADARPPERKKAERKQQRKAEKGGGGGGPEFGENVVIPDDSGEWDANDSTPSTSKD